MIWLWIGDSLLEGMTPAIKDLSAAKGVSGAVSGRSGWGVGDWLRSGAVADFVARYGPDAVVFELGTNDDRVDAAAVRALVSQAGGARVVWFGPFHTAALDADFAAVLGGAFVPGVPVAAGVRRLPDGVHYPASEYPGLAARLVDAAWRRLRPGGYKPLAIALGTVAVVIVLAAVLAEPAWERRWRPGERHPFGVGRAA